MNQRIWMKGMAVAAMVLSVCVAYAADATVAGDAYVNSATPATNYGGLSNLYVSSSNTALIQFDLSSLPAGTTAAQISKATVKVYVNRINTSGLVSVLPVTSAWSESAVTYATIPALGTTVATFTPTTAQQFVVIDITSLVQGWVTTPSSNYGIALTSTTGNVVFDSKENDETSHVAHLDITVVSQGPQGPIGPQGIQGVQGPIGPTGATGATGPAGPTGPQGLTGATGPTGAQGPPVSFKNAWSSSMIYSIGDAVSENGSSYIALANNFNVDPATNPTLWAVLAAKGDAGATGPQGPIGLTGLQGPIGLTGPQGPIGLTGPQGPIGLTGPQGPIGLTGPTGATGPPVNFKGAWSSGGPYSTGDAVSYNGSSYIALQANTGTTNPSSDTTNWALLAAQGATGTIGAVTNYASGTSYSTGQVVFCATACTTNGSSYISLANSNQGNDPPTSSSKWTLIAQAGATGAQGPQGTQGIQGATGPAGVVQGITTGTIANSASAGAGTASIGGTAANPNININFPNDVQSITAGTVSNTAAVGAGTLTIGGTATNPQININFPASSTGFTWSTAGANTTENGPDIENPLDWSNYAAAGAALGPQGGYAFVPTACTVKSLFVAGIYVPNPGFSGANTITVTVQHNGTDTAMTCAVTITNNQTTSASKCVDSTHTFTVAEGDTLAYSVTQTNQEPTNASGPYNQVGTTLVCE